MVLNIHINCQAYLGWEERGKWYIYIYDLVPKGAHARGYGLCTSVENKTLLKTVFI